MTFARILRRILVIVIVILPVFADMGCRKQEKCGCDGDMLYELDREQAKVYFTESSASFSPASNPYYTYYFCNPGEMFPKLKEYASGDLLIVSGKVFWECNFIYQSSNYSYQTYYKVYMIQVSDVTIDLYGKK